MRTAIKLMLLGLLSAAASIEAKKTQIKPEGGPLAFMDYRQGGERMVLRSSTDLPLALRDFIGAPNDYGFENAATALKENPKLAENPYASASLESAAQICHQTLQSIEGVKENCDRAGHCEVELRREVFCNIPEPVVTNKTALAIELRELMLESGPTVVGTTQNLWDLMIELFFRYFDRDTRCEILRDPQSGYSNYPGGCDAILGPLGGRQRTLSASPYAGLWVKVSTIADGVESGTLPPGVSAFLAALPHGRGG